MAFITRGFGYSKLVLSTLADKSIMGIDLRWEDEKGNRLAELPDAASFVEQFLPDFKAQDFPCLRFVDPYGDTVFNQFQISQVIAELERLSEQQHEPEVERHLGAVLDFTKKASGHVHTYIKFYGD